MSTIKLPGTLARIHAELRACYERGDSTKVVDMEASVLRDDHVGLFLRLRVMLADGGVITLDTIEPAEMLRAVQAH